MNCKKILRYLYSLESPKIKLGLERINTLLAKAGNPEKGLRCIHVAGTNGKGSVCAMIFYVLREAGYKVGLYSSTHLKRFNERIRVNGHFITDKEIVDYFLRVKPFITNQSFFEITTAMAFIYFKEKNVDFVVLETGLGGRLDATNVIVPLISAITNIELEHTELLGNTIEKIAFEKAGIIKNNVPVVTGAEGKALQVIEKIAKQRNVPLILAKKYPKVNFKHLNGAFQQQNKDIALTAIEILKKTHSIKINENQIIDGIKKTRWAGRLQFISRNVLADCAHNPSGFEALKNELGIIKSPETKVSGELKNKKFLSKQKNIQNFIFVIGVQKDKDAFNMLKTISPLASAVIFTKSKNEKALNPQGLLRIFNKINKNKTIQTKITNNPKMALRHARKTAGKNDLVVVTGSIYLVGEVI